MNGKKTTFPSRRNREWRWVKTETEKNLVQIYISTNNTAELNKLIYAGAKLICKKIGVPFKSIKEKIKTWKGNSTVNTNKKSTKTGKNDKTKKKRWNL